MNLLFSRFPVRYTRVHKTIDFLCLLAIASMFVYAWSQFQDLPHLVPTHFDFRGRVDTYGSKTSIFVLPGIALFVFVITLFSRFNPRTLNVPFKVTEENADRVMPIVLNMISGIQVLTTMMFGFILFLTISIAKKSGLPLRIFPVYVFVGAILLLVALSVLKMRKTTKRP